MKIYLTKLEMERCEKHAEDIVEFYRKKWERVGNKNNYNHNKVESNRIGVRCEVATERWVSTFLDSQEVISNFWDYENNPGDGDIDIRDIPLEIKGLQFNQWQRFRRMVPPKQLEHYCRKNAVVIWGLATKDAGNNEVELKGWNWANEIKQHGVEVRTICDNIWLQDDNLMRPMSELKDLLKGRCR